MVADHPLVRQGNRFYIATAVARTASLSISAEADSGDTIGLDATAVQSALVSTRVSVEQGATSELRYVGNRPLAFGVELHELGFDPQSRALSLSIPGRPVHVRGVEASGPERHSSDIDSLRPAFIGGMDGDVLLHAHDRQ
jgi:hypothetical protein